MKNSGGDNNGSDSNIQVFLRVRPSKNPSGYFHKDDLETNRLGFTLPDNYKSDYVNNSKLKHSFLFNGIVDMTATQDEVFKKVGVAAVQNAIDGFNSTIFAYGQTGSGKTFTLTGGPEKYSDRGIIPRSISMLFNEARNRTDMQFKFYISYLEIYNEEGYDLLDETPANKSLEDLPKVKILEDEHGNYHLKNLSMHLAETEEEALNLLFLGDTNRAIAETPMNQASSRSHCIFTVALETRLVGSDKVRRSKLHLVDLAGSERVAKTNSSGSVLTEAKYINTSLFFLEMVIVALYEKATKGRAHIPYRNSMMTSVLRDSLGGNCKTIMVATINPEASHTEESLSTCRFAQRVSLIKNSASINEEMDPNLIIKRLKNELLTLREEISYLKGEAGEGEELTPIALDELRTACKAYCYDHDPNVNLNIGSLTLTKIKAAFTFMKSFVQDLLTNNPSTPHHGGGGGGGNGNMSAADLEELEKLRKNLKDVKSLLLQRDSEINILVNMVKKNSTGTNVNNNASTPTPIDNDDSVSGGSNPASQKIKPPVNRQAQAKAADDGKMSKELQAKIIERHLFGVPPPTDRTIFDDAAQSFEWFRERSSLNQSVNENKEVLKDKINEAKTLGTTAEQSRKTIEYLKKSIEQIRRDRAFQGLNNIDNMSAEVQESTEEESYRRAIEQEKKIYTDSVTRLKELKPQIEHIRKILEKCRGQLQSQFDEWYNALHSRPDFIANFTPPANNTQVTNAKPMTSSSLPSFAPSEYKAEAKLSSSASFDEPFSSSFKAIPTSTVNTNSGMGMQTKSTDESVNEDIMAFYAAKNELLKKRGQNS